MFNTTVPQPQNKNVIIQSVDPMRPSKQNEGSYTRVYLKDAETGKSLKFNLNKYPNMTKSSQMLYDNWSKNINPGAVLNVTMQQKKGNENFVDQSKGFKIVKEAHEAPKKVEEKSEYIQETPEQLILGIELDNISRSLREIIKSVQKIREDYGIDSKGGSKSE